MINVTGVSLTSLTLNSNHLTTFPLISKLARHVQNLYTSINNLKQIDSTAVARISSQTHLNLGSNHLTRIPAALIKYSNLQTLEIYSNQITSIEDFDLIRLHQLKTLYLYGNQLTFISHASFKHSPLLVTVQLCKASLNVSTVYISGSCSTGVNIKTNLTSSLPKMSMIFEIYYALY